MRSFIIVFQQNICVANARRSSSTRKYSHSRSEYDVINRIRKIIDIINITLIMYIIAIIDII